MAEVRIGPKPVVRYYKMSVAASKVSIPAASLMGRNGQNVVRAVGMVHGGSVCMGMEDIINPSTTVGIPIAVADVIVLEGLDNIKRASFVQDSGAADIFWMLEADTR
jgi:hypothetical protein